MAHNLDFSNNRANIAFRGSRRDIWHRLGQEMQENMSIEQWAKAAGLDWRAVMVSAYADLSSAEFDHIKTAFDPRMILIDNVRHCVRSDTGKHLGVATNGYVPCQPAQLLNWFQQYISVNDKFQLDVAGSLKGGRIIWATAVYNGDLTVAGDRHVARLLMTTTFDCSGATINQGTVTRVVCNNTLNAALANRDCIVRTRHNTAFNAERVGKELAQIAQGFEAYKTMGEAMALVHLTKGQISQFFKSCLDIPFDVKADDVSTRKLNQFNELNSAYQATVAEGTEPETAWTALNAVTRYIDHDRSTKRGQGGSVDESRFLSSQFGSGAALKTKAVANLYDMFGIKQTETV